MAAGNSKATASFWIGFGPLASPTCHNSNETPQASHKVSRNGGKTSGIMLRKRNSTWCENARPNTASWLGQAKQ